MRSLPRHSLRSWCATVASVSVLRTSAEASPLVAAVSGSLGSIIAPSRRIAKSRVRLPYRAESRAPLHPRPRRIDTHLNHQLERDPKPYVGSALPELGVKARIASTRALSPLAPRSGSPRVMRQRRGAARAGSDNAEPCVAPPLAF